jgi:diamine N-acetyltransferase
MKLSCITPKKEDLWYRKSIVEDELTMEFNNGTVPFPEEKWDDWYARWIGNGNPNFWYAYLVDNDSKEYVGEIAYRKRNDEEDFATLNIIVEHKHRGKGYGKDGLHLLVTNAFKNGFHEVRDFINRDSNISHNAFSSFGFRMIDEEGMEEIEFRLTKDEYVNLYGEIK